MAELEASTVVSCGGDQLRNAFGGVLCAFALILIGVLDFSIRLFSVIKYESVIHEFDPYFNYCVTQLNSLNTPLSVETVRVFTAPIFSAYASWATYLLTKDAKGHGAGLMAATILAMVPSYISRSIAGSYDTKL